jgi:drug/metabolite transporter (DMT)-like permease
MEGRMNSNYIGMILGGIIPAIIFGLGGIFVKASNQQGISFNYFTLLSGIGVIVISILSFIVFEEKSINIKSGLNAFLVGSTWACGVLLVAMALTKYDTPMSIISPLNGTACLFTVLLALFIFSEWKEINAIRLFIGTVLIIAGVMLVSTSSKGKQIQRLNSTNDQLNSEYSIDQK